MATYDNLPPVDGWQLPPRCCGTWASDLACGICGQWLSAPENIQLAET